MRGSAAGVVIGSTTWQSGVRSFNSSVHLQHIFRKKKTPRWLSAWHFCRYIVTYTSLRAAGRRRCLRRVSSGGVLDDDEIVVSAAVRRRRQRGDLRERAPEQW